MEDQNNAENSSPITPEGSSKATAAAPKRVATPRKTVANKKPAAVAGESNIEVVEVPVSEVIAIEEIADTEGDVVLDTKRFDKKIRKELAKMNDKLKAKEKKEKKAKKKKKEKAKKEKLAKKIKEKKAKKKSAKKKRKSKKK